MLNYSNMLFNMNYIKWCNIVWIFFNLLKFMSFMSCLGWNWGKMGVMVLVFLNKLILFFGVSDKGMSFFDFFLDISLIFCKVMVGVKVMVFEGEMVLFFIIFYCEYICILVFSFIMSILLCIYESVFVSSCYLFFDVKWMLWSSSYVFLLVDVFFFFMVVLVIFDVYFKMKVLLLM